MRTSTWLFAALLAGSAGASASAADQTEDLNPKNRPPVLGIHWARGEEPAGPVRAARRRSPNMTYHGGKIMPTAVSKAIFWGPSWANTTFVGDKISGLDAWYTGHDNSNYATTVDEYTGTERRPPVDSNLTHQGHVVDTSTATGGTNTSRDPRRGLQADHGRQHRPGRRGQRLLPRLHAT